MTVKLFSCCPYCNAAAAADTKTGRTYACGTTARRQGGGHYTKGCGGKK